MLRIFIKSVFFLVHKVQKKWLNLRTCFSRELKLQKRARLGQISIKRRKYIYYDKLSFLKSSIRERPNCDNHLEYASEQNNTNDVEMNTSSLSNIPIKRKVDCIPQVNSFEDTMLGYQQSNNTHSTHTFTTHDEDTHFVLSIVPSLRELSEDEKLDAKIKNFQVFKEIRMNRMVEQKVDIVENYPTY